MVAKGDFIYQGDHLICPEGKVLRRSALQRRDRAYQYVAHQKDCQSCPVKARCLPPHQNGGTWPSVCITHCCSRRRN